MKLEQKTALPGCYSGVGILYQTIFLEIVLDCSLICSFCNGGLIRCVQIAGLGLVVVIIETDSSFLATLPVGLSGAVGLDVITGGFKVIFVCKPGTIFVEDAVDMMAKSIIIKPSALYGMIAHSLSSETLQNIIRLGICNLRNSQKVFSSSALLKFASRSSLFTISFCELTASPFTNKCFLLPQMRSSAIKIPP